MGTDGNALARCTCTASVTGDRFEGLLTEPDTMGVVPRTEGLAFLASPRLAPHATVAGGVAVNPRGNVKKGDVQYRNSSQQVRVGTRVAGGGTAQAYRSQSPLITARG